MPSSEAAATTLRLSQAARELGLETREVARLVHERQIRHVMVDGIAHIPADAVEEYRSAHASDR
jgi:excisionase family DNA binding protein